MNITYIDNNKVNYSLCPTIKKHGKQRQKEYQQIVWCTNKALYNKCRLWLNLLFILFVFIASLDANAYVLKKDDICFPSMKWGTNNTVKVRLLTDSAVDYINLQGYDEPFIELLRLAQDVQEVIDEYNSISGIDLELELAEGILGDDNLESMPNDDYNNHSVIIGFTDEEKDAPAWTNFNPDDNCTLTEVHIRYRKEKALTFGAPESTDVNGKSFDGGMSFRATLLHEMGHAVGLRHETNAYAVMDHGTKAWTRGKNEIPQMQLLPDDINGLRAIYGNGNSLTSDVSLTNTWFIPADQIPNDDAAQQTQNCKVSSRGDSYADRSDGLVYCGVNDIPSTYPVVNQTVCPGDYIQVRYTLNNNGDTDMEVEEQLWFSADEILERSGSEMDIKSPDIREFTINSGRSATLGRVYRVPSDTPEGEYHVFAHVVLPMGISWEPMGQNYNQYLRIASSVDPITGDADKWNNSIRVRGTIFVETNVCP